MKIILPDGSVEEAKDELRAIRHTASHVLAQAVKRLYPETKLAIGPAIDDGFYYDFDREGGFTPDDLEKLEAEMKKIVKENLALKPFVLPRDEAIKFMQEKGEPYKVELIEDLPEGETISFYQQGDFVDLCAGPHILYTKGIKAFKLTSIAGAYWRGSEKNKMLTRIYGTAFAKKEDLEAYLTMMEEAKKRDHRKLGKELGLFMFAEEGPGFPFFLPKGMTLKNTLIDYWREIHLREGYQEVSTPVILSRKLWETSGHWDHYKENMYTTVIDDEDYAIKPMNCPGGMLVYKSQPRSYRDLPLRVGELSSLALIAYLQERGINIGLAKRECRELRFMNADKPYFAIGFPNMAGGYEVRNRYFKGCVAPKDITHIRQQDGQRCMCYLFEGFMDYLSFLTIRVRNNPQHPRLDTQDYVILNSVSNLAKAESILETYTQVGCFLDNDTAGRNTCTKLKEKFGERLLDKSMYYREYKDLNDYLCGKPLSQSAEPIKEKKQVQFARRMMQPPKKKGGFHL